MMNQFKFLNNNNSEIKSFYIYIGNYHYRIFTTNDMDDINEFVNTHIIPRFNFYSNGLQAERIRRLLAGRYRRVELLNIIQ